MDETKRDRLLGLMVRAAAQIELADREAMAIMDDAHWYNIAEQLSAAIAKSATLEIENANRIFLPPIGRTLTCNMPSNYHTFHDIGHAKTCSQCNAVYCKQHTFANCPNCGMSL